MAQVTGAGAAGGRERRRDALTPEARTALIRQVTVWAALHPRETAYVAPADASHVEDDGWMQVAPGRPHFVIDRALEGCGYQRGMRNERVWRVVYEWMYERDAW